MSTDSASLDRPEAFAALSRSVFGKPARDSVADLYAAHALSLTRLAHVMLGDRAAAEDVVQDAFCGVYRRWDQLEDPAGALPYVRSSVLNGCRTALRRRARAALDGIRTQIGYAELLADPNVAKISVVGVGMRSHAGVAAQAFRALAERSINIRAITTSEIKFSLLIDAAFTELAVRTLHSLYGLDKTAA